VLVNVLDERDVSGGAPLDQRLGSALLAEDEWPVREGLV
jgi:hypothetical protein